ncbi:MAG: proline--tRNA ligase, partial [Acidobacteriota bacterium]|nr:proline--tRNA ligase [Acidobacteriota bacterium]
ACGATVVQMLDTLQQELFDAALARREEATMTVEDYDAFKRAIEDPGGFLLAHWCGDAACEARIQQETKATIRCIALDQPEEAGTCLICDGVSNKRAHFAKSY